MSAFYNKFIKKINLRVPDKKNIAIFAASKENGSVAQLVEHDTLNVGVVGSRPTGTTDKKDINHYLIAVLF